MTNQILIFNMITGKFVKQYAVTDLGHYITGMTIGRCEEEVKQYIGLREKELEEKEYIKE